MASDRSERRAKDALLWAALESHLQLCKARCAAISREIKALLAERRETDDGRAARRRRLAELQALRGDAVRKMLAADREMISARWPPGRADKIPVDIGRPVSRAEREGNVLTPGPTHPVQPGNDR